MSKVNSNKTLPNLGFAPRVAPRPSDPARGGAKASAFGFSFAGTAHKRKTPNVLRKSPSTCGRGWGGSYLIISSGGGSNSGMPQLLQWFRRQAIIERVLDFIGFDNHCQ
jgi:hypothetical protein